MSTLRDQPVPAPARAAREAPCEVTVIANDIGAVGGMERVLAETILGLRERGHEVTVISRRCALPATAGISFHRVLGPRRPFPLAYPWFMLVASLMLPRRRRGVVLATGAIVLNRVDAISVHYCHQVGPTNTDRTSLPSRINGWLTRRLKRDLERVLYNAGRTRRFVCVSDGVAAEMREHYPRLAGDVVTIHNGVDTERFKPGLRRADAEVLRTGLGIPEGRLVAAFVGGEWDRKGLAAAIEALAAAPGWDLVVAGGGDEQRYRALAASFGVEENVHLLGVVQDVAPLYELADAFVLPSTYETFSLVTFEAAAAGLAIIAAPVSGVRELIEDGRNGFLVAPRASQIAARLRELAADPGLRATLGEAARDTVQSFSWTAMVGKYEQLLEQLAADR